MLRTLSPQNPPVVALAGQPIPTTSNVNAFECTLKPKPMHEFREHIEALGEGRLRASSISGSEDSSIGMLKRLSLGLPAESIRKKKKKKGKGADESMETTE